MRNVTVPDCSIPERYEVQVWTRSGGAPTVLHRWSSRRVAEQNAQASRDVGTEPSSGKKLHQIAVFDRINQVITWQHIAPKKRRG